jgi:hypothetical protein
MPLIHGLPASPKSVCRPRLGPRRSAPAAASAAASATALATVFATVLKNAEISLPVAHTPAHGRATTLCMPRIVRRPAQCSKKTLVCSRTGDTIDHQWILCQPYAAYHDLDALAGLFLWTPQS